MASTSQQTTLYWHDYETWGEVPSQDRPSQFAGVRTDTDLNIIGDPLMMYCKPAPDVLPKPEACLVTGLSPQVAEAQGLAEAAFVSRIAAELSRPGTCGAGYNSIRFDDEVTRYALYRNFYDPYEREWKNGNSRWDIIDMVRMTRALRPEGINWPDYEDGTPCFKLEMLTKANRLEHGHAHDALSDVYATIALARLVRERQPRLYDFAWRLRDKRFANSLIDIDGSKPVLHISSRFSAGQGNAAVMLPLALHPANKNSVIAFNLSSDPADLLKLSAEELHARLYVRQEDLPAGQERLALKEIHLNKTPMILPLTMLDASTAQRLGLDRGRCERHWQVFNQLSLFEGTALREKLAALYAMGEFAPRTDPEQMLYSGGFFSDTDKRLMKAVRLSAPEGLAQADFPFEDARLPELLFRYRARNYPHTLSAEEQQRWQQFCYQRLTDPAAGASIAWPAFAERLVQSRLQVPDEAGLILLQQLQSWAEEKLRMAGGDPRLYL